FPRLQGGLIFGYEPQGPLSFLWRGWAAKGLDVAEATRCASFAGVAAISALAHWRDCASINGLFNMNNACVGAVVLCRLPVMTWGSAKSKTWNKSGVSLRMTGR